MDRAEKGKKETKAHATRRRTNASYSAGMVLGKYSCMNPDRWNFSSEQENAAIDASTGDTLVAVAHDVANEFSKHPRTIKRWARDPKLGFPKLVEINRRLYVSRRALDAWKAGMLASAIEAA